MAHAYGISRADDRAEIAGIADIFERQGNVAGAGQERSEDCSLLEDADDP